jgi:hypothetical protein
MYVGIPHHLKDALRRKYAEKWEWNSLFLLHYNASDHQSFVAKQYRAKYNVMTLGHPPFPWDRKYSKRTTFRYCHGNHHRSNKRIVRGIKKWFPRMLPKPLQILTKVCHCPRELFWSEYCVSSCMITYLCVINQFWELFEATYILISSK